MTINMTEKKTMNTNSSTIKTTAIALIIGLASMFSINANAQSAPNLEAAIGEFIVEQGHQMMTELNKQLQQSIESEVKAFTFKLTTEEAQKKINSKLVKELDSSKEEKNQLIAQVK
jgi:hypothetical protein